jgi:hypothetical protein
MPPGGHVGHKVVADGDWRLDITRSGESLHGLHTDTGKAAFRNWLACGAPVVGETKLPSWAQPGVTLDASVAQDWTFVYMQVIQPNCALVGCHVAANAVSSGHLDLSSVCGAYAALQQAGDCGKVRAAPGDGESLLVDKLEHTSPSCGDPMPTTGLLPKFDRALVRSWVEAGMPSTDCK